jgi:Zn-dependent protease with chaperone function
MADIRIIVAYLYFIVFLIVIPYLVTHSVIVSAVFAGLGIIYWIAAGFLGNTFLLNTLPIEPLNVAKYHEIGKLVMARRSGRGLGAPEMWLIRNTSPMIMSIGMTRRSAHILFTQGFFDNLDDKTQIGLTIREIESIREGRTASNTGLAVLLWLVLLPGRLGGRLAGAAPGENNMASTFIDLFPAFFLGLPIGILGADRKRIYVIDNNTLGKLDNPDYLPYGLMKLQDAILASPFNCDLSLSGNCIINPMVRNPYQSWFKLHPPTPKRIDRLRIRAKSDRLKFKTSTPDAGEASS